MIAATAESKNWTLPDLDTLYHLEDHDPMTLGQMLDGIDDDLIPRDQIMYEDLLWAFGAWESLEQIDAAMEARVYETAPDGKVGFRLVK